MGYIVIAGTPRTGALLRYAAGWGDETNRTYAKTSGSGFGWERAWQSQGRSWVRGEENGKAAAPKG